MKIKIIILTLVVPLLALGTEKKESKTKKAVSSFISNVVSTGKDVVKGVDEGIDSGRKEGESRDGAVLIMDKESLEKNIKYEISSVEKKIGQSWSVTVVFKNEQDNFIRVSNLSDQKNLQLLNEDGIAAFSSGLNSDVTIPSKASVKTSFSFKLEGKPQKLRIYGIELEIPETVIVESMESAVIENLKTSIKEDIMATQEKSEVTGKEAIETSESITTESVETTVTETKDSEEKSQ